MKQAGTSLIAVRVTPKSRRNGVEGVEMDATGRQWLKVRLTVAPEDGKANKALIGLLAKEWDCSPSSLVIVSGETSRHKLIRKT